MKSLIGRKVRVSFCDIPGVIIGFEQPWGEEDEFLYEVKLEDGKLVYAVASQIY